VKTIWKFPIDLDGPDGNITDRPLLAMPGGAEILTLKVQRGQPTLWAIVEPEAPPETHRLAIVGTGQPMPGGPARYLGTWLSDQDGTFVFHVFDLGPLHRDTP
jgi:hypothetical protein